jgi:hypothetical protein
MNRQQAIEQAAQAIKKVDITGYPDCKPLPISTYRAYAEAALEALALPEDAERVYAKCTVYDLTPACDVESAISKQLVKLGWTPPKADAERVALLERLHDFESDLGFDDDSWEAALLRDIRAYLTGGA